MAQENKESKVMSAAEAVRRFVFDGAIVGVGGQTIGRSAMAIFHEIIRQNKKDLTLVGCNLSLCMDMLVGAGRVRRTECGTGNMERFGTTFAWRKAIEQGKLENEDYSHLAMASRFLAGEMGLPFMPTQSLLGTDILARKNAATGKKYEIVANPWNPQEKVVLLPALSPDVAIIHAQRSDEQGNLVIEGFLTHEPEMIRASKAVIVSCEEIVPGEEIRRYPERTTIPYPYVSAVVLQPWGAHPTGVYRYYQHDAGHIQEYQKYAREGGKAFQEYLGKYIFSSASFDEYLEKVGGLRKYNTLRQEMMKLI
ncbi:MAG: CoA transferase subunit A [Deltaproteobacteria bacterium]|nr:CoA transferase subunit A [Deltaproteobacteria bacterium]